MSKLVKVSYSIGDFQKFVKGEIIEDTQEYLKVRGFGDGTVFTIYKKALLEVIELKEGENGRN